MQQLLEWQAGATPWCGSFHGFPPALCCGWHNGKKISTTGNTIEPQVQDRVALKGSTRRRLHIQTTWYMNHLERSQKTAPLTSIQEMPGSVPKIIQELERYGEPRHRTHWWLITTWPSKKNPTSGIGIVIGQCGYVVARQPPLSCQKVSWFHYPSYINDLMDPTRGSLVEPPTGKSWGISNSTLMLNYCRTKDTANFVYWLPDSSESWVTMKDIW